MIKRKYFIITNIVKYTSKMSITVKNIKGITDSMDMSLGRLQEIVKDWEAWHFSLCCCKESETAKTKEKKYLNLRIFLESEKILNSQNNLEQKQSWRKYIP